MTVFRWGLTVIGVVFALAVGFISGRTWERQAAGGNLVNLQDFAPPAPTPIHLEGAGEVTTAPFTLRAGHYQMRLTTGNCAYYFTEVKPNDPNQFTETGARSTTPGTVQSDLYIRQAGEYHLEMVTGPPPTCPWSAELIQQ